MDQQLAAALVVSLLVGCGAQSATSSANVYGASIASMNAPHEVAITPEVSAAIAAPDRWPDDRARDADRHPGEVLSYFGVQPGMRVAVLASGTGYTAELVARIVGDDGLVYAQNDPAIFDRFGKRAEWNLRAKNPVNRRIMSVESAFDDPLPPDADALDVVVLVLAYHELVALGTDRAKMNAAIFRALKPGGVYGVVDHSAREGTGLESAAALHRIESHWARDEIKAAGFVVGGEGNFLHDPADPLDTADKSPDDFWSGRTDSVASDRFVLKLVKPSA